MALKRTPLYDRHVAAGARMVEFGGWEMPVQYEGIVKEHKVCRATAGLFDVSHMGELRVAGFGALEFLQRALTNEFTTLQQGRCRYSLLCNEQGGILDDLLVYREGDDRFLLVVNAANTEADRDWLLHLDHPGATITDLSAAMALLAVQGPQSAERVAALLSPSDRDRLDALRYYAFDRFDLDAFAALVSRTGYTGDKGFEIFVAAEAATTVWGALLAAAPEGGLVPVGLGARDTLRLEAGFCLHGHDIAPDRNPIEADLARFVAFDKGDFVGREALARVSEQGPAERLVGLAVEGREIIRDGCPIAVGGAAAGMVTSGSFAPSLGRSVGMGYLAAAHTAEGTPVTVEVRGKPVACRVAARPFYRPKST